MNRTDKAEQVFTSLLLDWHKDLNDRQLPWKNEKDPYKIWLSEIILQQTRAQQGLPYYLKFTAAYPSVVAMANANDEEVFKIWQGLGYYNRCKNMLATARLIVEKHAGQFPNTYDEIIALKGIGPYTAAAIASFAFGLPHAVVDGNVYRVLSRYFAIDTPIDETKGKQLFADLAQKLLSINDSAAWNQSIMDLGATVCTPKNPQCDVCPFTKYCQSKGTELLQLLPVKSKKVKVLNRYFNYVIIVQDSKIWMHKRGADDIWQNLYEPFLLESDELYTVKQVHSKLAELIVNVASNKVYQIGESKQKLTHRNIFARFFRVELTSDSIFEDRIGDWVEIEQLKHLAMPKTVADMFSEYVHMFT